jgi:hypothetical protein
MCVYMCTIIVYRQIAYTLIVPKYQEFDVLSIIS